jgi:DNA anti-recombination protein RmuC
MVERMSTWPDQRQFTAKEELGRLGIAREELIVQVQNTATALADHLADKLDAVNRSRNKTLRKIQRRPSDKLNQKHEKEDKKAAPLVSELERLKLDYYIEADPAFKRKERKYPLISAFDSYVSSLFNKDPHQ